MQPSTADTCKEFYGFRDMPFSMAVDGDQNNIYLSQNYETSLAILVSSLDKYMLMTQVVGVDGVGKTTLINYLYKHVQQDFFVGMVKGDLESSQELLKKVLASFGQLPKENGKDNMLNQLQRILSSEFESHGEQSSLLIIDDVDNMGFDALKDIELLLGLNSNSRQLLQLILVGQPELEELLSSPKLLILSEIARTLCSVKPLSAEETQHYIQHRLNMAGGEGKVLFDEQVCSEVFKYSKGIPKKINSICNDALLRSSSMQIHGISAVLISEVANESKQEGLAKQGQGLHSIDLPGSQTESRNLRKSVLTAGVIFTASIFVLFFLRERLFSVPENRNIEIPHKAGRVATGNNSENIILPPPPQKAELLENLAEKDVASNRNLQKELTENLLKTAELHLRALRLTTPDGENAFEIYRGILEREPSNEMALNGIKQIAQKYVELANRESGQGAASKAIAYLEQAAIISPESDTIQKALEQAKNIQSDVEKTKLASKQAPDPEIQPSSSVLDKTVAKLFVIAEQQIADFKFLFPKNDNAYKTYTKILSLLPNDKRAYAGLRRIANHYLVQAKIQRDKGEIESSQLLIVRGLKVVPKHKKLIVLKKEIDAELTSKQEAVIVALQIKKAADDKLKNLLNKAKKQQKALHLTTPPGNNALESYNKALQIDSNNVNAQKGLISIAKHYQSLTAAALASGNADLALATANEGLTAFPKNEGLLSLMVKAVEQQESALKKAEVPAEKKQKDDDRGLRSFGTF
jgi:type II secretory pathway predicted ATPase ExeA/tetratricopeptide (TPR) repeat protein